METIQSCYDEIGKLISAFSLADPDIIAAMLLNKISISKEDEARIHLASTPNEKAALVSAAIMKSSLKEFQDFFK